MYTPSQSAHPIMYGMHIHPALSEVVERAFDSLMSPSQYREVLEEHLHLGLNGSGYKNKTPICRLSKTTPKRGNMRVVLIRSNHSFHNLSCSMIRPFS
jgi:hypothetical protein